MSRHRIPPITVKPPAPMKDPLVFISYSSRDKLVADKVCSGLEGSGFRCWIAPPDITPGKAAAADRSIEIKMPKGFKLKLPH